MLDIGWQELLVIGVIALLVVGPKELPGMLRNIGRWAGRARSMARDFQRSMEDAAREADIAEFRQLKDTKREFENLARFDPAEQAKRSQSFLNGGGSGGDASASATTPETPAAGQGDAAAPAEQSESRESAAGGASKA